MSKKGSKETRIEQVAKRITGLDKLQIAEVVYTAAEDLNSYGANGREWFDIRTFKNARDAAWFRYWASVACPDFDIGQDKREYFYAAMDFVVTGRVRLHPAVYAEMPRPEPQTQRAIQIKERVAGASLADLEDEANRLLDTADFSSGSATFRSQLSRGAAGAIEWLLNYKMAASGVSARVESLGIMSDKYEVRLEVVEVRRLMSCC